MASSFKSTLLFTCFIILSFAITLTATAQVFNGKNLKWELDAKADKRIKAFFGTLGSAMGSEEASLAVENLTQTKLSVKFKLTLTDFCGVTSLRNISYVVRPMAKAGTSPWFDGFTFNPTCKERKKYGEKFYTRISNAKIEIVSIQEVQDNVAGTNKKLECKDLIAYRDKKLVAAWDKNTNKYKLSKQMVTDIASLKDTLLKHTQKGTTNLNLVLLTLKTAANAIEDVISVSSPQGYLMKVAKTSGATAISRVKAYEAIKKGDKAFETLVSEDAAKTVAIQAATELGRMGSILGFIKNFHDNIQSLSDYQNVKQEVNKQMANLNKSMVAYNTQLTNSQANIKAINQYKEIIDSYLKENCAK